MPSAASWMLDKLEVDDLVKNGELLLYLGQLVKKVGYVLTVFLFYQNYK